MEKRLGLSTPHPFTASADTPMMSYNKPEI